MRKANTSKKRIESKLTKDEKNVEHTGLNNVDLERTVTKQLEEEKKKNERRKGRK